LVALLALACSATTVVAPGGERDAGNADAAPGPDAGTDIDAGLPAIGEARPGRRLSPVRWVPVDGTPLRERFVFRGEARSVFRDTGLASRRCVLSSSLSGGAPRCFPRPSTSLGAYGDAECSEPVGPETACLDTLAWGPSGLWRRSDLVRLDGIFTRTGAFGGCEGPRDPTELGFPASGDAFRYDALSEAELVALTEERRAGSGSGATEVIRRYRDGTVERFLEPRAACRIWRTADGHRCVAPTDLRTVSANGFADEACTVRTVTATAVGSVVGLVDDAGVLGLLRVVERANRRRFTRLPDGECVTDGVTRVFGVTEPVDLSSHPRLTLSALGAGRLQPLRWLDDEGRPWIVERADAFLSMQRRADGAFELRETQDVRFRDTALDLECVPWATSAGLRCLPARRAREETLALFGDAACTEPVTLFQRDGSGAVPTFALELELEGLEACGPPPAVTVRPVIGPSLGSVSTYARVDGVCVSALRASGRFEAFPVGAPVPLERFAAFRADG
ncbi:MAG: hypothetical protein AAGH15_03075, partial [Myxococcota bacterium]